MQESTIPTFPSPMAVKHFVLAAFTTGKENVMRSGGGFGESIIGNIHSSVTAKTPLRQ
jgi:hypothetical protein